MPDGKIGTFTGRLVDPLDLRPEDIDIWDIVHSLSLKCRYNGHCFSYFSVAEHSVLLSKAVPPRLAKVALLHDAAEAYFCDLPRPIKALLPAYAEAEHRALGRILLEFLDVSFIEAGILLKELAPYDHRICVDEMEALMPELPGYDPRERIGEPLGVKIKGWSPFVAQKRFFNRYAELFS